ncbi:hypothetical protein [Halobacillus sp. A5]|uniref:hypothetical protein n=1 Tax=Halobacillus sp. A5 TaxID=2880263 RepID=UPI0020A6BC98|nr:hypothetical protein [Halobacillus sp. A5]MCP3025677.1 hypothetical protein [Halobacillus sp. A5]
MKHSVRFFSLGIAVSTVILSSAYWLSPDKTAEGTNTSMNESEMIQRLEESNYQVLSDEELQQQINEALSEQTNDETKEESSNTSSEEEKSEEEEQSKKQDNETNGSDTYTLVIKEGISSTDISQSLEREGIIDNANSFDKYLSDRKLTQYIQIGEFELNSGMNRDEVADAITR